MRYPTGREVNFGRNNDGTWMSPPRRFSAFTKLADNSGSSQVYASSVLGSRPRDYFRLNDSDGMINPINQVTGHPAT